MNPKSLLLFLVIVGAVVWFALRDKPAAPVQTPESLTAGQQRQMEKAKALEQDMQKQLDDRMRSAP